MPRALRQGLNDSGEPGRTFIVRSAALHVSRGQATSRHAHYAWKLQVGLDAPVWLRSSDLEITAANGRYVVLTPPGLAHETGAVGNSIAIFIAPGTHGLPWHSDGDNVRVDSAAATRLVSACREFVPQAPTMAADFIAEVATRFLRPRVVPRVDRRVELALGRLAAKPDLSLAELSIQVGLSLDRLSHLVSAMTGFPLRRHALWSRLLRHLSTEAEFTSLASAAAHGGFADHAHLTRTCRRFLGRAPSDFERPPNVIAPWSLSL